MPPPPLPTTHIRQPPRQQHNPTPPSPFLAQPQQRKALLPLLLLLLTSPLLADASAPPGGTCGNGQPGNDVDSRCASNICRGGKCCDPSVGLSCLSCSAIDGFCTQSSCFACVVGEGCTVIGQGFGCCKPAELLTCFRGCDLNGDCFPLALPGQSCRGDADCATDKCRGADTGNGVCCRADVFETCEVCSAETGECLQDTVFLAIIVFSSIAGCALILYAVFYWYLYQDTYYMRRLVLEERQDSNVVVLNPEEEAQERTDVIEAHLFDTEFSDSDEVVVEVTSEEERQQLEWEDRDSSEEDSSLADSEGTDESLVEAQVISENNLQGIVREALEVERGKASRSVDALELDKEGDPKEEVEEKGVDSEDETVVEEVEKKEGDSEEEKDNML